MNIYAVCVGLLGLVWFLLIFQFSFTDCASADDDRNFVEYYGNHPQRDGIWETGREMRTDVPRMKGISRQVHYKMFHRKPLIANASLAQKYVCFDESLEYKPMQIDVLLYLTNESVGLHHFTQGLFVDCVYYLEPKDAEAKNLTILRHVCGIEMKSVYGYD